jgi:hypothetical protein
MMFTEQIKQLREELQILDNRQNNLVVFIKIHIINQLWKQNKRNYSIC